MGVIYSIEIERGDITLQGAMIIEWRDNSSGYITQNESSGGRRPDERTNPIYCFIFSIEI